MEVTGVDLDSNSLVESIHPPYTAYIPPRNGSFGVMYNLFKPGNNFNLSLLDSDSSSSADPIRADCSLNDGVALELPSPREEIFKDISSKRTSVHIQIEDEIGDLHNYTENQSLMECTYNLHNFVPTISQSCTMKTSNVDMVSENITLDNNDYIPNLDVDYQADKEHSSPYSDTHIPQSDAESDMKQSECLDVKPTLTVQFLTMENSNNAIDNNLHINGCDHSTQSLVSHSDAKNHIFKLPNKELTFNGTLKHLQKLQPIVSVDCKDEYITENHKDDMAEYFPYKSSDELTNSSPGGSLCSSKSGIFSSASQFPSDCDATSNDLPQKRAGVDNSMLESVEECEKNLTFAGAVSPLKNKVSVAGGLNKCNDESLNSACGSGPQSPNMFSDDEDDYNEQKIESEKIYETFRRIEESDSILIKLLEKTLQGVLPPPSITICQLSVNEILDKYKTNLERFEKIDGNSKDCQFDPEASASMTPPRQINCDTTIEPSLSSSMVAAFDNTLMPDQTMSMDNFNNQVISNKPCNNILFVNGSEHMATNDGFPQVLNCRYYGVHYNSTQHSETVDCLLSRYASRYVGCETASTCITIPMAVGTGYRGMVRRQHPSTSTAGAPSPSRRLSHLARRRAAFCTAATLTAPVNRAKQILIDRKKFGSCSRTRRTPGKRTPGRKTPGKRTPGKKTPAKKTPGKKTPSSSQKKAVRRLALSSEVKVKSQPTRETSKRALFLSPDNVPKPQETQQDVTKPSTSKILKSKRALFGSPTKNSTNTTKSESKVGGSSFTHTVTSTFTNVAKKRPRDDSNDDFFPLTKLQKSLSFGGDKISSTTPSNGVRTLTRRATEFSSAKSELSDIHKKKLLWAVAEALRAHGIGMSHDSFKQHATSLVRLTRKLCTLPVHMTALKTPFSSTSDTLLKIARLHAYSVIKGKSVDELFAEEQVKQMNSSATKVTGYVPLMTASDKNSENSYGDLKVTKSDVASANNRKTVLQDKMVNIDTNSGGPSELDLKKPTLFRDGESKLRARRQISFDNMEPTKR